MIHTLLYKCFQICSDWTKFYLELDVFKSKGYSDNFINNFFKTFQDNKHRIQGKLITVPKKTRKSPSLPWTIIIANQNQVKKMSQSILNCCKLQIVFKNQNKLTNAFRFEDRMPFSPDVVFSVGSAVNPVMVNL